MSPLKIVVYSVATVALAVVGLGMVVPHPVSSTSQLAERVAVAPSVDRFDDPGRGVTCYIINGGRMSCVVTETLPAEGGQ